MKLSVSPLGFCKFLPSSVIQSESLSETCIPEYVLRVPSMNLFEDETYLNLFEDETYLQDRVK